MFAILWEFVPAPGKEREFEAAYGPKGLWAEFFADADGFLGTDLLREADGDGPYMTFDRWRSADDYDAFVTANRQAYAELDEECQALTTREFCRGSFEIVGS